MGSVPICALYWIGRFIHNSGPRWVDFGMFFFMPGYYFVMAMGGLLSILQLSQRATITLIIVFDCMFWSLVVQGVWGLLERLRDRGAMPSEPEASQPPNNLLL